MVFSHVPISLPFSFFFDHSALFIPQKKACAFCINQLLFPSDQLFYIMYILNFIYRQGEWAWMMI